MTVTGLGTVNFANFHWYSQVVVFFIIILGGQVWKHTLQVASHSHLCRSLIDAQGLSLWNTYR
jgi:hypothetical protein